MALGASARTLFSLAAGVVALAAVALPAGAEPPGPDCNGLAPTIFGSTAGEWILGTEGDDVIRAGAGDDTVMGLGGDDVICAGPGNDTTRAGSGNDTVRSGRGDDSSSGESGDDSMRGQGDTDYADGGVGVDECFFEDHVQCEADLDVTMTGPATATKGGTAVSVYHATLVNHGPTPAVNARVEIPVPTGATFIAGASDSRCSEFTVTEIRCVYGPMGLEIPNEGDIGFTFAGCSNPGPVDITGKAEDPRTNDHVPPNDTSTRTTTLSLDPVCNPEAVNDSATVGHDSGANTIDVLANDIDHGASLAVASTTNGAHGTAAVTNGGANVAYTPAASYCGPDSFTYSLTPGGSTATVTVDVLCPTAVDDSFTAYPFGGTPQPPPPDTAPPTDADSFRLDVLPNDINPPGSGPIKINATSVTQPIKNGNPAGSATVIENGGAIEFTPDGDECFTTYTLTYKLVPGDSQATVTIFLDCGSE